MPEKECKLSQKESKAFSKRQRLANLQGLAICCSTGCLKAGVKNSKPKRPQSLKIINFFFLFSFSFLLFLLSQVWFWHLMCSHLLLGAQAQTTQHKGTSKCWATAPGGSSLASFPPSCLPAPFPSARMSCQVPCHLGSLSDHSVSPSFVRQGNAVTGWCATGPCFFY